MQAENFTTNINYTTNLSYKTRKTRFHHQLDNIENISKEFICNGNGKKQLINRSYYLVYRKIHFRY